MGTPLVCNTLCLGQLEKQGAGNGTGTGTGTGTGAGPERYRITSLIRAIKWVQLPNCPKHGLRSAVQLIFTASSVLHEPC